jgi:hypothetical protein
MADETQESIGINLRFSTSFWQFHDLTDEQLREIVVTLRRNTFADTRALQRYLEICDFQLVFMLHPPEGTKHLVHRFLHHAGDDTKPTRQWKRKLAEKSEAALRTTQTKWRHLLPEKGGPAAGAFLTYIDACAHDNREVIDSRLNFTRPGNSKDHRFHALSLIDVRYLRDETARRLKRLNIKTTDLIAIGDAGEIWHDRGKNMKANIQAWMRKTKRKDGQESGPIFRPIQRAEASDPRGSWLDFSDMVTVPLIHWMLKHGARYSDFEGSPQVVIATKSTSPFDIATNVES